MKCANCDRPALYVYEGPAVQAVGYCGTDLPRFLQAAAKSGALNTTSDYEAVQRDALRALSPIQATAIDTEPEPEPTPEPTPAPKRTRRKSAPAPVEEAPDDVVEPEEEFVAEAEPEETSKS